MSVEAGLIVSFLVSGVNLMKLGTGVKPSSRVTERPMHFSYCSPYFVTSSPAVRAVVISKTCEWISAALMTIGLYAGMAPSSTKC